MSYTKDLVIDTLNEIDDEETRDSLFRLHEIMLARDTELVSIANKSENFYEFKKLIRDWFRDTEVVFLNEDLKRIWEVAYKIEDLTTMRKED
jgi:hypothetical protein